MLYKIAINNTIHIPFLRKYFGFSFFNALPPPLRFFRGGGQNLFREGQSLRGGDNAPFAPEIKFITDKKVFIDLSSLLKNVWSF